MASDAVEFAKIRYVYDDWIQNDGGQAAGAWIDGYRVLDYGFWYCYYSGSTACPASMPWSAGEPNRAETEKCLAVWHSRTDGVANYDCAQKLPAICGRN